MLEIGPNLMRLILGVVVFALLGLMFWTGRPK